MQTRETRIPGEEGIWVLILGDLFVFSLFFLTFVYYRGQQFAVFEQSALMLNRGLGLANTILLLTSSLFVAMGVHRVRKGLPRAARCFSLAILCGLGFVVIKGIEYHAKFAHGTTVTTNDFFMLYFAFTGIHLLHVLVGLGVLSFLATSARATAMTPGRQMLIECGALFWHLVDLLWVMLFSLFYLLR